MTRKEHIIMLLRRNESLSRTIDALNSVNKQLRDKYELYDRIADLRAVGIHAIIKPFHDYKMGKTTYAADIIIVGKEYRVIRSPRLDVYLDVLKWVIDYVKENNL